MNRYSRYFIAALALLVPASADAKNKNPFDWSGFYIGGDAGHFASDARYDVQVGSNFFPGSGVELRDFAGGAHAGFRRQVSSRVVLGIEADFWGVDAQGLGTWRTVLNRARLRARAGGSLRGVAGVAFDATLAYLTGGVSFLRLENCATAVGNNGCIPEFFSRTTIPGWTLGVGIARALSPHLIARIEYLYARYEQENRYLAINVHSLELPTHTVRAGISWRFSTN